MGSVAFDNVITPFGQKERILGGAASYCSLAASYFAQVRMVGVIGNDFGNEHLERLRSRGIDLEGVQLDESGPTFFWKGKYHENFNRWDTLDIQLNAFENSSRPARILPRPRVRLLGNIHPALQMHVLDQMPGDPFVLADTIDLWIDAERKALLDLDQEGQPLRHSTTPAKSWNRGKNAIPGRAKARAMGPLRRSS